MVSDNIESFFVFLCRVLHVPKDCMKGPVISPIEWECLWSPVEIGDTYGDRVSLSYSMYCIDT